MVLYRSAALRRHQYTRVTEWSGGLYISPGAPRLADAPAARRAPVRKLCMRAAPCRPAEPAPAALARPRTGWPGQTGVADEACFFGALVQMHGGT